MRLPWFLAFFSLLSSCFFTEASARGQEVGEPYLVRDIASNEIGSAPRLGAVFANRAILVTSPDTGIHPWSTDGTTAGTMPLHDLGAGSDELSFAANFTIWNDRVVFTADNDNVIQLWLTDGTPEGTHNLPGVLPGIATGGFPAELLALGSRLVFVATDETHGRELWVTDGTAAGTAVVDIVPGVGSSTPTQLTRVDFVDLGSRIIFLADDGAHGREPWITDGTVEGSRLLADIRPGSNSTENIGSFIVAGGRLFFGADDGVHGFEPWTSDGTSEGTLLLSDLMPGPEGSLRGAGIEAVGGAAFIAVTPLAPNPGLWWTDGTTFMLLSNPVGDVTFPTLAAGGWIYFVLEVGISSPTEHGFELWRARPVAGTAQRLAGGFGERPNILAVTTERIYFRAVEAGLENTGLWAHEIENGNVSRIDLPPALANSLGELVPWGDGFVFSAADGSHGRELWFHDGIALRLAADIAPGALSSSPKLLVVLSHPALGDLLLISADDTVHGAELWVFDGTETRLLANLVTGATQDIGFGGATVLPDGRLWMGIDDSLHGWAPWITDGTSAGTYRVADAPPGVEFAPRDTVVLGERVVFYILGGSGFEPWGSDGTPQGTQRLADIELLAERTRLPELIALGNRALFAGSDSTHGDEPWVSDGTSEGTFRLADLAPGVVSSSPLAWASIGMRAFFVTAEPPAIWSTDGTSMGTARVRALPPFFGVPKGVIDFNGRYVVAIPQVQPGVEFPGSLWISDGTRNGTFPLLTEGLPVFSHPRFETSVVTSTFVAGDRLYFTAAHRHQPGPVLWLSDGTPGGTQLLSSVVPQLSPSTNEPFVGIYPFGDHLAIMRESDQKFWITDGTATGTFLLDFPASLLGTTASHIFLTLDDGIHGYEPWVSDGTRQGTHLLADLAPGPESSTLTSRLSDGNHLYFVADNLQDSNFWVSNGTSAGTRLIGTARSSLLFAPMLQLFSASPRLLYFLAHDDAHGLELWALPLAGPDDTLVLGPESRFEATVTWRDFRGAEGEGTAVALTEETGAFWFFEPSNLEVMVKVLDGRGINGHWWVYWGSLSNVGFTLTVRDLVTGAVWRYENPLGRFASGGDIEAF